MSPSHFARRGTLTALTAFAAAILLFIGLEPGKAGAVEVTRGQVVFSVTSGKAGRVSAVSPAKVVKRFGKKGAKVSAAAKNGTFGEKVATGLESAGGLKLANGKRSVKITGLKLAIDKSLAVIRGNIAGKKNVVVFTAAGKGTLSADPGSARFTGGKMQIPPKIAGLVRKKLKLKKAPNGQIGTLFVNAYKDSTIPIDPCEADPTAEGCDPCEENPNAEGCQPVVTDPYLAECNVPATSQVNGSLTPAAALPTLLDPQAITGLTTVSWGIKTSFRNYLVSPAAAGSIHARDGATATGTAPAYSGFDWTFVDGQYSDNGTPDDPSDDRAILNLNGTVVLCATGHNFRVAVSDPTIVIDGANSRIVADVDSNLTGVWTPAQRIDLATLSPAGTASLLAATQGAKWENVPAAMTENGGKAICGVTEPQCPYTTGTAMDPVTVEARTGNLVDTYNDQCGVAAASRVFNAWAGATSVPDLSGSLSTTSPTTIDWGFKSSFRGYVYGVMAGAGKGAQALQALAPASRNPDNLPSAAMAGFSFPVDSGKYEINEPLDTSDDQAVINGSGGALFCNSEHGFWMAISHPTIVIDGDNSRLIADYSTNESGVWNVVRRVDLATLNLDGITPTYNKSGSEVSWGSIPATLNYAFNAYPAGTTLDPVTVAIRTPYDLGAGDAAAYTALATYVSTNLPFPNADPAQGGCEVGVPAGGTAGNARTIDENIFYGGTEAWYAAPNRPAAVPAVTGTSVTGGGLDWGFRRSLRASINATGQFNLTGGATAKDPYVGNGPGSVGSGGQMGDAGDYFTWPSTSGTYNAAGAGDADDQLVLKTQGTVALCQSQSAQRYATIFSNPTVIIDGANSRITIDVLTRYRLSWVRATVDFASINLSGITIGSSTTDGVTTKTWTFPDATGSPAVGPVSLTSDGEKVVRMLATATYVSGLGLDGATIRASFPE